MNQDLSLLQPRPLLKRLWFLIVLIALGLLVLLGLVGYYFVQDSFARKIGSFIETSCSADEAKEKILVVYESKYAATGKIAETIANGFCDHGFAADVLLAKNVKDLTSSHPKTLNSL